MTWLMDNIMDNVIVNIIDNFMDNIMDENKEDIDMPPSPICFVIRSETFKTQLIEVKTSNLWN